MEYPIAEIFLAPQGEGFNVGKLMTFVRLAGCTVGKRYPPSYYGEGQGAGLFPIYTNECTLADGRTFPCDTNYTLAKKYTYVELLTEIQSLSEGCMEICLTGGEPLMHAASGILDDLCTNLVQDGYSINLETSGTITISEVIRDVLKLMSHVCISPKKGFREEYLKWGGEFKILIDENFRYDEFPFIAKIAPSKVFLQPINGEHTVNLENLNLCLVLQKKLPEARISLQAHKLWNTRQEQLMSVPQIVNVLKPIAFHFRDPKATCTHWSDGQHIVTVDGTCKCGKKFMIVEVEQ